MSSLKRKTLIYGISIVVERMITLAALPILTKKLPQEYFGAWSQMIVITGFAVPVLTLSMGTGFLNFHAGSTPRAKLRMLNRLLGIGIGVGLLVLGVSFIGENLISRIIFGDALFEPFVRFLAMMITTEIALEYLTAYLRLNQRIEKLSLLYILKSAARALSFLWVTTDGLSLISAMQVVIGANILLALYIYFYEVHFRDRIGSKALSDEGRHAGQLKTLLLFTLPLVPTQLMTWFGQFADRFMVLHFVGLASVAKYAFVFSIASVTSMIYVAINFTFYPHVARLMNTHQHEELERSLRMLMSVYFFLSIPAAFGLTAVADSAIILFSTSEYLVHPGLMFMLTIGFNVFGVYQLLQSILLVKRKSAANMKIVALGMFVNVAGNFLMVPLIGIMGAALAILMGNLILAFLAYQALKGEVKIGLLWPEIFHYTLISGVMFAAIKGYQYLVPEISPLHLAAQILLGATIYLAVDLLNKSSHIKHALRRA